MKIETNYCGLTDVGQAREINEDNYYADPKLGLYVVCDGMGGHAAGEVASEIAVRTYHKEIWKEKPLIDNYLQGNGQVSKQDILNIMSLAATRASTEVHAESLKNSEWSGMGTTLVSVLIAGPQAFILNVGDSRAYLLRNCSLEQLTTDHTVYNELVKSGQLSMEQADMLGLSNSITRAIGTYEHTQPETLVVDLLQGDRFLLCSDGLSHYFEDEPKMLGDLLAVRDLERGAKMMVDAANDAGGGDNITVIAISIDDRDLRDTQRTRTLELKHEFLSKMPLFNQLDERELLHVLQVTEVVTFDDGKPIIEEGEEGDSLFILLKGQAHVKKGGSEIAALSAGDHFGEMALVRGEPRSASVISNGPSELMVIRRAEFFEILRQEHQLAVKLLWQFLGVLSNRFADTNQQLGKAKKILGGEDITWQEIFKTDGEDPKDKTTKKSES